MPNKDKGGNLIFLISQPRSGSTMLQLILSLHPEIHTTSETWLMLHPIYALRDNGYVAEYNSNLSNIGLTSFLNNFSNPKKCYLEAIRKMTHHLYSKALESSNKRYFLDKTPRYYLIIPELFSIFPEAKFIILLRNPLSVLSSIIDTWVKGNWLRMKYYHIDLFEAPNLLFEGIKLLKDKALVLRYEDFVYNTEDELTKVIKYLNLDFDPEIINYGSVDIPDWSLGDKKGVRKYKKPEKDSLDNWLKLKDSSQSYYLANQYLEILGPTLLDNLGYNYFELKDKLSNKLNFKINISMSWDKIFAKEQTIWNKAYLRTLGIFDRLQRA